MLDNSAVTPAITISFIISFVALVLSIVALSLDRRRFGVAVQIALPLVIVALIGTASAYRFRYAGMWSPALPDDIGAWKATDTPIQAETLALLGSPKASAHEYQNQFGEVVYSTLVSAGPFENYHDPTVCVVGNGFTLTAKKILPMGMDDWKVRALVFKRDTDQGPLRILMYYWTQTKAGHTAMAAQMGAYQDILPRLQTGYGAVVKGEQNTILRIYAIIPPDDKLGVQTQRNLNEICRATYKTLKEEGAKSHE